MKRLLIILLPFILFILPQSTFAETSSSVHVETNGDSNVNVHSNTSSSSETHYSSSNTGNISIHTNGGSANNNVSINNDQFVISGKITTLSDDKISISDQEMLLNPAKRGDFKIGDEVTVKGTVKSGGLYVSEINGGAVLGTSTTNPFPSSFPFSSMTPSPFPSMSPFMSPFPSNFPFNNSNSPFKSFFERIFSMFKSIF